jgi:hypothetical protein
VRNLDRTRHPVTYPPTSCASRTADAACTRNFVCRLESVICEILQARSNILFVCRHQLLPSSPKLQPPPGVSLLTPIIANPHSPCSTACLTRFAQTHLRFNSQHRHNRFELSQRARDKFQSVSFQPFRNKAYLPVDCQTEGIFSVLSRAAQSPDRNVCVRVSCPR